MWTGIKNIMTKSNIGIHNLNNGDRPIIGIVGLGYVGLPLAVEFSKHYDVIGFDINKKRIKSLNRGEDESLEVDKKSIELANNLYFTSNSDDLSSCNIFIVTVPTPIDKSNIPDLGPLISASKTVGKSLKKDDYVIYESTVYPGVTEEDCIPVLEEFSKLKFNKDFYVGYSPERINPGDKSHRLSDIKKITSGSTPDAANFIDNLYRKIILSGTHKAESIKIAEAAKVIENTQRDLNIALINELAILFNKMDIDTEAVLRAAETKWNFIPFKPGLVGGHCIGVDPYYLTYKAQKIGYNPEIILAGRNLNDQMSNYVLSELLESMKKRDIEVKGSRVLIMGLTFKENCPDLRNSKVFDILKGLDEHGCIYDAYDPWVSAEEVSNYYGINILSEKPANSVYDAILISVAHDEFKKLGSTAIRKFGKPNCVIYDLKYLLEPHESDLRL